MNVSHFHEFIELARTLSFHEAARKLFLSQSTLSKHIAAMEKHYGTKLFDRSGGTLSLSGAGALLLESALKIWSTYEQSEQEISKHFRSDSVLLVAGALEFQGHQMHVHKALHEINAVDPNFQISFANTASYVPLSQLAPLFTGQVDCVALYYGKNLADENPKLMNDLCCEEVFDLPLAAYVSSNNPLMKQKTIRLSDLSGCTFIELIEPRITPSWKYVEKQLLDSGIEYNIKPLPLSSSLFWTAQSIGNSLLLLPPENFFRNRRKPPNVEVLPIKPDILRITMSLFFQKNRKRPIIDRFLEALRTTY
jgi:DNA-binding transcriptional LysR family regulator